MKKLTLLTAISFLLLSSCSDKNCNTYCNAEDPMNEIKWLKELVNENENHVTIYKLTYNNTEGFYIAEEPDSLPATYYYKNCNNTEIYKATSGGIAGYQSNFPNDFEKELSLKIKIYPTN